MSGISFFASGKPAAQQALAQLTSRYGQADFAEADFIVAIGGDGTTLRALHETLKHPKPVFAMRIEGSLGYLSNTFSLDNLLGRLKAASSATFHPLRAQIHDIRGNTTTAIAVNEVTIIRQGRQSVKLRVFTDGWEKSLFAGDGVLVATPIGSMAYNRSAGGPALGLDSGLLALTGLLPFHSVDWINSVLSDTCIIEIEVQEADYRFAKVEAGLETIADIAHVRIARADQSLTLLLEPDSHRNR